MTPEFSAANWMLIDAGIEPTHHNILALANDLLGIAMEAELYELYKTDSEAALADAVITLRERIGGKRNLASYLRCIIKP
jgi:hypothetical protein